MSIHDLISESGSFQPEDIEAMSVAFADVCLAMGIREKDSLLPLGSLTWATAAFLIRKYLADA